MRATTLSLADENSHALIVVQIELNGRMYEQVKRLNLTSQLEQLSLSL